jgi:cyclopropane-fatty-acyl-phospholipid synthase
MVDIWLADLSRRDPARSVVVSARQASSLLAAGKMLDSILKESNLSVKISVGAWNNLFGSRATHSAAPELIFSSYDECLKAIRNCRLYNFAISFFKGRMRIVGPVDEIVNVLYAVNIRSDLPQSIEEKLTLFLFRTSKRWVPRLALRFESNFHYSLDVRAYRLFLDPYLQYTCGRFLSDTDSVDKSQIQKFELIKTWVSEQLGTIERKQHLDIGCGWGGLVSYFRESYGTESIGLTNCGAQRDYIHKQLGVQPIFGDFTAINHFKNQFDFVTVIGMSEHVAGALKDKLLKAISRALKDDGVLYFQSIQKPDLWIGGDAYRVAQELIFPGHDLDFQQEAERRFIAAGFKIVHSEDHSLDYARTTGEWAARVNRNFSELEVQIGTNNASLFLMYLSYASKLFENGRGKLMRYALVKDRKAI